MTVALYSGSLTQFFLGAWIDDLPADEDVEGGDSDGDTDDTGDDVAHEPQDVLAFFETFRAHLTAQLQAHVKAPLAWTEAVTGPHAVAVIEAEEYGALMLAAARIAAHGQAMPAHNRKRAWSEDAAVRALVLSERGVGTMHHLVKADTWLPGDFLPIVFAPLPYADVRVGSIVQLAAALALVGPVLDRPDTRIAMLAAETIAAARRAFTAFATVAVHARAQGLPMVVDV